MSITEMKNNNFEIIVSNVKNEYIFTVYPVINGITYDCPLLFGKLYEYIYIERGKYLIFKNKNNETIFNADRVLNTKKFYKKGNVELGTRLYEFFLFHNVPSSVTFSISNSYYGIYTPLFTSIDVKELIKDKSSHIESIFRRMLLNTGHNLVKFRENNFKNGNSYFYDKFELRIEEKGEHYVFTVRTNDKIAFELIVNDLNTLYNVVLEFDVLSSNRLKVTYQNLVTYISIDSENNTKVIHYKHNESDEEIVNMK